MNGWQTNPLMDRMVVEALSRSPSLCVSLSLPLSIHPSIHPSIDRSIDRLIYRSIDLSIYRSIDLSIYRSIDLSIYLSIYRFIYLSIDLSISTHSPRGLPGLQHWGFPVVEHEKRNCKKYCVYGVFSAFGVRVFRVLGFRVLGFWVRRPVSTKTLATRRFLSMSKDYILNSILTLRAKHRVLPYL